MAKILLKGNVIETVGSLPEKGSKAPNFVLSRGDLSEASLADYKGKKVVLNIFPSIDTSNSHFVPKRALLNGIEGFIGSIGGCVTHSCSAFSARRSLASCFLGPSGSFRSQ